MQDDPWVKNIIGQVFARAFESALNCTIEYKVKRINVFSPCIELVDVRVRPKKDEKWSWHAKAYTTGFTWRCLLGSGMLDLHVGFNNFKLESAIQNGQLAIISHIKDIVSAVALDIPTFLKEVRFYNAQLIARDHVLGSIVKMCWTSEAKKIGNALKASIHLRDGSFAVADRVYANRLAGTFHVNTYTESTNATQLVVDGTGTAHIPQLADADSACFFFCFMGA